MINNSVDRSSKRCVFANSVAKSTADFAAEVAADSITFSSREIIVCCLPVMTPVSGTLFVVATPIGNLDDLSTRARDTLTNVACIYAEDTRHSARLLDHYSISTRRRSLHEHNETSRIEEILQELRQGKDLAIISDAGTPLLSDPGYRLVLACKQADLAVAPVPGASALLAALCVCGQPVDAFTYVGFPPSKKSACESWLKNLARETRTLIMFESPHRVVATLEMMARQFGPDRSVTVARELTKRHESITLATVQQHLQNAHSGALVLKGEFVLVVAGFDAQADENQDAEELELTRVLQILLNKMGPRDAAECAAQISNCKRNRAYKLALTLAGKD